MVDRFHVVRWFASALTGVQRRIRRIAPKGSRPAYHPDIFRCRYLPLRREDRLEPETHARLEQVLTLHPDLGQAWHLYQHLHRIYTAPDDVATRALLTPKACQHDPAEDEGPIPRHRAEPHHIQGEVDRPAGPGRSEAALRPRSVRAG